MIGVAALVTGSAAVATIAAAVLLGGAWPAPSAVNDRRSDPPANPTASPSPRPTANPSPTPVPSPTLTPSPTPDPIVAVEVPVVSCATRDGGGGGLDEFEPSERLRLPQSAADRLAVFATNYARVLAPSDWHCTADIGANGTLRLEVTPAGDNTISIVVEDAANTFGDIMDLACPFFPDAAKRLKLDLGLTCDQVDQRETVRRVGKTIVWFADPAGVTASGAGSGGANPVVGVVHYLGGNEPTAAKASCVLPEDALATCTAILEDWLDRQAPPG